MLNDTPQLCTHVNLFNNKIEINICVLGTAWTFIFFVAEFLVDFSCPLLLTTCYWLFIIIRPGLLIKGSYTEW